MKKLITTLILLVMFISPSYAKWEEVAKGENEDTFYVDFDRVRIVNGYVYFWILTDRLKPDSYGDLSFKGEMKVDCKLFRFRFLSFNAYSQPMGKGKYSVSNSRPDTEWRYPEPNSSLQIILRAVCNQLSTFKQFSLESDLPPCPEDQTKRYHNCFGTLISSLFEKYIGEWKNDKKNGHGYYSWDNGEEYIGQWKSDLKNGQGNYFWPNGDKYIGQYKDDNYDGNGKFIYESGVIYIGQYKDNNRHGHGTVTWPNGQKYTGRFKDDLYLEGTLTYSNGNQYVGEFKDNQYHGQGTYTYAPYPLLFFYKIEKSGIWENGEYLGKSKTGS